MKDFIYTGHAQRVLFGSGTLARLGDEVDALGAKRALLLCTPGQREEAQRVADVLGPRCASVFAGAMMHVPIEVAREARIAAARLGADCAVAFGGGSTIGLGKAIALESGLPVIAVPTTYSGSEMTGIYGLTEAGVKRTGIDPRARPRTVIYDVELTHSLPLEMSVASGMNAIAHAAESLYARDVNPIVALMAEEGIRALGRALPLFGGSDPAQALAGRSDALYGAWLCGTVLGSVGMSLHHKLCHTLGGSFNLPHAQTHSIVLPHALAYNAEAAPEAMSRIAAALGGGNAAQCVYDLAGSAGALLALKDVGLRESDLDRACELALRTPYPNPRRLEAHAIRQLLQDAYDGVRPSVHA
ncbi:maleylacetate reductase [Variovorax sp. YR216]|uniref:maleylacetate reductase n=1 Tax=Variovorax sp. YR216 TaxID=1882828 RepID=UPI00089578DD|nr:maleylacetate reductase [Variovorax sp. YR216]SEB25919.1 maleylacetate reductase [Variovorax sp. YR216]